MQWLWPLMAVLAFAFGAAFLDRNPAPLLPLNQQQPGGSRQSADQQPKAENGQKEPLAAPGHTQSQSAFHSDQRAAADAGQTTEDQPKWTDRVQAYMAIAVAAFTLVLAVVSYMQLSHIGTTAKAAQEAAEAADLSARAAIALELPLLRVTPSNPIPLKEDATILFVPDARIVGAPIGQVTRCTIIDGLMIYNAGRTAATPLHIKFGSSIANQLEGEPFYMLDRTAEPYGLLPAGNSTRPNTVISNIEYIIILSDAEAQQIQRPGNFLWVYAEVSYSDFMDNRRDARFCWRWERDGTRGWRWVSRADVPAAYLRKSQS